MTEQTKSEQIIIIRLKRQMTYNHNEIWIQTGVMHFIKLSFDAFKVTILAFKTELQIGVMLRKIQKVKVTSAKSLKIHLELLQLSCIWSSPDTDCVAEVNVALWEIFPVCINTPLIIRGRAFSDVLLCRRPLRHHRRRGLLPLCVRLKEWWRRWKCLGQ